MKWWPFGGNNRGESCEVAESCGDEAELEEEATEEYLESLPAYIRNDEERLRRARRLDHLEQQGHKLFDSQILQLREIRARLAKEEK